jgi:O-antigen/teichoic acid export membrane protein
MTGPTGSAAGRWLRYLHRRPFDTSTAEGRSAERYRRIAWSTVLGAVGKAVAMAVSFITVPLMITYLGVERYGLWLTVGSIVAVLGPLDLGIGYGLLNTVAEAHGRDDQAAARRAVSTALLLVSAIAFFAALVLLLFGPLVPWAEVYNVTSEQAVAEAAPTAFVLIGLFIIAMPLSIVGTVQAAYQSAYVGILWGIGASVASLFALLVAMNLGAGLPALVLALAGTGVVAAFLNGILLFRWQRPWLRPRFRDFDTATARRLTRLGLMFVVLQLAGLAAYQLDNLVIAQILGAEAVPQYAVPMKLFIVAPTIVSFALAPLWPAYRESLARGDSGWVLVTLRRSIKVALAINVPISLALVVAGPTILHLWVGPDIAPTLLLLVGLAAWAILNSLSGPLAMLLNGANAIGFQAVTAVLMAVANVAISILLVREIGVAGAVFGSLIAQVLFVLIPYGLYIPRLLARIRESGDASTTE